ncbi:MAG: putative ubiquitin carboxyl-terminal hydrolase [Streblomastix strix]|uniref:ubiquitinyl hydrolase 1 n=1 Tax=Streblomastix strix TaxID=222440 RepID=A0A5J4X806_9EUKA|nr:MAG: putative ubiquitin carboxyl-terminal hydrolase [Streblomastix strix]
MAADWGTIESDPGVFTLLLEKIGVSGVECVELFDLEPQSSTQFDKVFGLVFLFNYTKSQKNSRRQNQDVQSQLAQNSCCTVALLSIAMNRADESDLTLSENLLNLREFSQSFSSKERGQFLANDQKIREAHNAFVGKTLFQMEQDDSRKGTQDAYHFISYVPVDGFIFELDGLAELPVKISDLRSPSSQNTMQGWEQVAAKAIQYRIASMGDNELEFSLIAIVPQQLNRMIQQRKKLARIRRKILAQKVQGDNSELLKENKTGEENEQENEESGQLWSAGTYSPPDNFPFQCSINFSSSFGKFINDDKIKVSNKEGKQMIKDLSQNSSSSQSSSSSSYTNSADFRYTEAELRYLLYLESYLDSSISWDQIEALFIQYGDMNVDAEEDDEETLNAVNELLRILDGNIQRKVELRRRWEEEQLLREFNFLPLITAVLEKQARCGVVNRLTKKWIEQRTADSDSGAAVTGQQVPKSVNK